MTNPASAARAPLAKLLLCLLVLIGLAACGADEATTNAATGNDSLVSPRLGMIDRQPTPSTPTTTTPTPATASDTPSDPPNTSKGTQPHPGIPPVRVVDGSATLDWTPPTQNSDGTTLTNLAGYTVYYGTSPDNLSQSVKLTNPGLTAFTVSNLAPGTWYFAVTSYSSTGVESARSGVVSTKI